MRAKAETPKGRHADPRAKNDATAEPWAPKGMQNSPGSKKPSKRSAIPVGNREPRRSAKRANARTK